MKRGIQMGFNLKKSKTIAPGVKLNFGKKGASVRLGGKGAGVTLGTSGKVTASAGIPGTGLYYTKSKKIGDSDNTNTTYDSTASDSKSYGYGGEPPEKDDKNKKLWKIAKKIWIVVGVLVLLLILLLVLVNSGDDEEPTTTEPQIVQAVASESQPALTTEAETEKVTEKQTEPPTEKKTEKQTERQTQKPTEKQTQPKSQTYMLNENTGKYHRPSCSTIKDSKNLREISAEEAKNYSPCGRCKP